MGERSGEGVAKQEASIIHPASRQLGGAAEFRLHLQRHTTPVQVTELDPRREYKPRIRSP